MARCKSGHGCQATATMRGRWCAEHGEQLDRVVREFHKRPKRTKKAVKPKAPTAKSPALDRWPKSDDPRADSVGRLPVEVRLKRLVAHLVAADGPVSREDAAAACGLASVDGGLPRIIKRGKAEGLIEVRLGRAGGLLPGPNAKQP